MKRIFLLFAALAVFLTACAAPAVPAAPPAEVPVPQEPPQPAGTAEPSESPAAEAEDGAPEINPAEALISMRPALIEEYGLAYDEALCLEYEGAAYLLPGLRLLTTPEETLAYTGISVPAELGGYPLYSVFVDRGPMMRRLDENDTGYEPGNVYPWVESDPVRALTVCYGTPEAGGLFIQYHSAVRRYGFGCNEHAQWDETNSYFLNTKTAGNIRAVEYCPAGSYSTIMLAPCDGFSLAEYGKYCQPGDFGVISEDTLRSVLAEAGLPALLASVSCAEQA